MKTAKEGYSDVLIGLQYGDEGKAKIIDALAPDYNIVARFNGGVNAGHTIVTDKGKIALRQIPSAIEYPNCELYIGSGCVVSLAALVKEIADISRGGYSVTGRLRISPNATVVLPHHILLDRIHGNELGTTGNGIGPAYADRAFRLRHNTIANVRAGTLLATPEQVLSLAKTHLENLEKESGRSFPEATTLLSELAASIAPISEFISERPNYLVERVTSGAKVLFEGAQSYMLDVVQGDVPFVTSSQTSVSAAYTGGDLPPKYHRRAFGVVKLVMSRVGKGPFPSEFGGDESERYCTKDSGKAHTRDYEKDNFDPEQLILSGDAFKTGQALRMFSGEYGTGSGRPRRIGMLDLAQLNAAVKANGIDTLFLTKCDCLSDFSKTPDRKIPVVTNYDQHGKAMIKSYESFSDSLQNCQNFEGLPDGLRKLIADIEQCSGAKVAGIGTGPHRKQLVMRQAETIQEQKLCIVK